MDKQTLWSYIDHTLLKPAVSWEGLQGYRRNLLFNRKGKNRPLQMCYLGRGII
jgi:hypothetical protein